MSPHPKTASPRRRKTGGKMATVRAQPGAGKQGASLETGGTALCELRVTVPEVHGDEVAAFLIGNGAGGVVEEPLGRRVRLVTYGEKRPLERLAGAASRALGSQRSVRVEVRRAPSSLAGWDTAWMENLVPVRISRTLLIVPTPCENTLAAEPDRLRPSVVLLEPALAFGFGEHPTTRLAARAMERLCRKGHVTSVLDVGTGSGVLAVVAAVSGARRIVGIDVDEAAVKAAKRNAALNGVESVCRFSRTPIARLGQRFDLVVANVDRGTLLANRAALCRALAPHGTLLLTGFLAGDALEIERVFEAEGLIRGRRARELDFSLVTLEGP